MDLRESKALLEFESVVFCDSRVITRPSRTVSSTGGGDPLGFRRYLANSSGKPWKARRESRTTRHWSGVGRGCSG